MTSSRPYLIRALYEWIIDNGTTPYLLVEASVVGVRVPPQSIKDGKVVLNIAPRAVTKLELADDVISFQARFSGVATLVLVPVEAVLAVYAMENGQGMVLPPDAPAASEHPGDGDPALAEPAQTGLPSSSDPTDDPVDPARPPRGAHLRVIK